MRSDILRVRRSRTIDNLRKGAEEEVKDINFKGEVSVRSTPAGFAVSFIGETDAHDLGHALAAIMTTYLNIVRQTHAHCDVDDVRDIIIEGIHCGLEHNPDPQVFH